MIYQTKSLKQEYLYDRSIISRKVLFHLILMCAHLQTDKVCNLYKFPWL